MTDETDDVPPDEGPRPWQLATRALGLVWRKTFEDRILGMAAEAGFWALVSLPSMLLAVFGSLGYLRGVIGPGAIEHIRGDVLRAAGDVLTPSTVTSDVAPLLDQVLGRGHVGIVSAGFAISLWSGSTAMSDYVNTITVAYGMRGLRSAVRSRLVALWLYLWALVLGIVLLPVVALGPSALVGLFPEGVQDQIQVVVHVVYWPAAAVATVAAVSMLYKVCLPAPVRWRRGLPGATVAMALWLAFSFAARAYLTSTFRDRTSGALGAPIAGLLFFYFTALAVLLGAELNSAIDQLRPDAATTDARRRSVLASDALRAALPRPPRRLRAVPPGEAGPDEGRSATG